MRPILTTLFLLITTLSFSQSSNKRYTNAVFPTTQNTVDVQYGTAPQWVFPYWNKDLFMDVRVPQGDTLTKRPLIIFAHAGGFLNGDKQVDDMVALCDSFARKGYVTATINYRMGFDPLDAASAERAVYRGIQDGKAAIRYFKQKQADYNIDTNYVFFGGMSAGSYMALHVGYMDKESERPSSTYGGGTVNDLGCLDCAGNTYPVSSKVRGILAYWGAVQDTNIIETAFDTPALLMHGVNDPTVPFGRGYAFGLSTLPPTLGSQHINTRMNNLGVYHEFYTSNSNLHMLDGSDNGTFPATGPNAFWYDTLLPITTDFLYKLIKPNPVKISGDNLSVCSNELFNLEVQPDGITTKQWIVTSGVNIVNGGANATFKISQSGNYQIGYVETNHILAISDTLWFTVNVRQSPIVNLSADRNEICVGESINLTVSGADAYTWNQGLSNDATQHVSPESTTTYQVIGTSNNCSDTNSVQITVNQCAGISDLNDKFIYIYPNPASDVITVEIEKSMNFSDFTISDITGKIILTETINSNFFKIDVQNLSEGIYIVQLNGSTTSQIYRLKIER